MLILKLKNTQGLEFYLNVNSVVSYAKTTDRDGLEFKDCLHVAAGGVNYVLDAESTAKFLEYAEDRMMSSKSEMNSYLKELK